MVGPQGSGKSTLIRSIVAVAPDRMACVDWEAAYLLSNADIRAEACAVDVVFVEALALGARHRDLRPGDSVLMVHLVPAVAADQPGPAEQVQEVRDAA